MEMLKLEQHIENLRLRIDELLQSSQTEYGYLDTVTPVIKDAMNHSLFARAKRIRPILAVESAMIFNPRAEKLGLEMGLCIELLHTYSLIHDDLPCMDDSDLRRGLETCHKAFGEDIATLAGDALLTCAWELLIAVSKKHNLKPNLSLQLISLLSKAVGARGMIAGQVLDLQSERKQVDLEALEKIHIYKTGKLFIACLEFGALIAQAPPVAIEYLKTYGHHFGLVFQITDDILDVTATSEQLGKQAGLDAANQKSTYPALLGINRSRDLAVKHATEGIKSLQPLYEMGLDPKFFECLIKYLLTRTH
ncbi:MAG: farnesyl diphosphate synthase [bacterium]|nr:farnesyl diphosphate synthase [bacterium]